MEMKMCRASRSKVRVMAERPGNGGAKSLSVYSLSLCSDLVLEVRLIFIKFYVNLSETESALQEVSQEEEDHGMGSKTGVVGEEAGVESTDALAGGCLFKTVDDSGISKSRGG